MSVYPMPSQVLINIQVKKPSRHKSTKPKKRGMDETVQQNSRRWSWSESRQSYNLKTRKKEGWPWQYRNLGGSCKETARFPISTLEKAGRQDIQSLMMQSLIKFSFLNTFGHKLFGHILKYIWTTTVDRHLYWKIKENIFNKQNPTKQKWSLRKPE